MNPFSKKVSLATSDPPSGGAAIQEALSHVQRLRAHWQSQPERLASVRWIKAFQTQRFTHQYKDFLVNPRYRSATQFFLHRLYGQEQAQKRDAQFARIANAIGAVFPEQVVHTAVQVSQLHALTETLDDAMGQAFLDLEGPSRITATDLRSDQAIQTYLNAWQTVGRMSDRHAQLRQVIQLGQTMGTLTKVRGLGLSLRMMRGPAQLIQLGELQNWLEEGFHTFCELDSQVGATEQFLTEIEGRESKLMDALFASNKELGHQALKQILDPLDND